MFFGPASFPALWFIAKGLWGEYNRRPPLWLNYEPEPLPEVSYYDSVCSVYHDDIFYGGCEDIKIYGDLALVSCDPYKKQSNLLTGYTPGTPNGNVYVWNYVEDSDPMKIDFGEIQELRPQGIHGIYTDETKQVLRIFVANAAKNASIEVFDHDVKTGITTKVISLRNKDAILAPSSVAPLSPTEIFMCNTLGYPYTTLFGRAEFLTGFPLGTIGFMNFTDMTNVTGRSVGSTTTPIGIEFANEHLYVASWQYGIYAYQLYLPPNDLDPELVEANKSLGRMHFYPGEIVYRTPYLPTQISYSSELDGLVSAASTSYSGEIGAWFGKKRSSWAGLLVDRKDETGKPFVVSDTVTAGLKSIDRRWQTLFWEPTGFKFNALNSMTVENGRRFGVSTHQSGVLICKYNGLETVDVPEVELGAQAATSTTGSSTQSTKSAMQVDRLEHLYHDEF
ncbi:uncharacterized protein V1516DRAFT_682410 [Lipomyces oligophaga]|uniref:uncharacterized protein n=1 Tax=Lipomyces oligophaga TaxID=45792 RepID=UPI0034CE3E50